MLVLLFNDSPTKYSYFNVNSAKKNLYSDVSSHSIGQDCQEMGEALDF